MKALLADNNKSIRSALKLMVENETGITVAGEVEDADQLVGAVDSLKPEIVIVDSGLPALQSLENGNGGRLYDRLRTAGARCMVIELGHDCGGNRDAEESGADYCFCKGDSPELLLEVIRHAIESSQQQDR